jgi:hypothetical protein
MNNDANFAPCPAEHADDTSEPSLREGSSNAERTTADKERSERNIRLWRSYLPPDCVNTMIRMGWDRTT